MYKNVEPIRDLFDEADEDYYIPIKTIISFDDMNNYIEYESKGEVLVCVNFICML